MQPIISPSIIYWLGTVGGIKLAMFFIGILIMFVSGVSWFVCMEEGDSPKGVIISVITFIFGTLILIVLPFIPSKETLIQIMIAQQITPDNLELLKEAGLSLTDFTLETVEQLVQIISGGITDVVEGVK